MSTAAERTEKRIKLQSDDTTDWFLAGYAGLGEKAPKNHSQGGSYQLPVWQSPATQEQQDQLSAGHGGPQQG